MAELKHVFIKPFVRRSPLHPTRKHLRSDYKLLQWRLQMSWAQHQPGDKCRGGHRGTVPWPSHHWDINIKISWQEVWINALLPGHQFFHSWILNCEVGDSILVAKSSSIYQTITVCSLLQNIFYKCMMHFLAIGNYVSIKTKTSFKDLLNSLELKMIVIAKC